MTSTVLRLIVAIGASIEASTILKATVVLGLALAAARFAPRTRASVRHALCAAAFCVVLMLPIVAALLAPVVVHIPVSSLGESMIPLASREPLPAVEPLAHVNAPSHPAADRRPASMSMSAVFRAAWTIGALLFLMPFILSLARIRGIRRDGLVWSNGEPLVRSLAAEAGVRRHVGIVLHHGIVAPMTCGFLRPAIVLPSDAPQWTDADVRHAVVHELEHVRRGDWPIHLVARIVCAL